LRVPGETTLPAGRLAVTARHARADTAMQIITRSISGQHDELCEESTSTWGANIDFGTCPLDVLQASNIHCVGRSDTITFAGLSLKVGPGLREKAPVEVQKVLPRLSRDGIEKILSMSSGGVYWDKPDAWRGREEYAELKGLGLVEEIPSDELDKKNADEHRNYGYAVHMTALGRQTQAFLRSVVAEFVQHVTSQEAEPSHETKSD
jgi:hypothetical protein